MCDVTNGTLWVFSEAISVGLCALHPPVATCLFSKQNSVQTYTTHIAFRESASSLVKLRSCFVSQFQRRAGLSTKVKAMDPAVHCYCRTKRWLDGIERGTHMLSLNQSI